MNPINEQERLRWIGADVPDDDEQDAEDDKPFCRLTGTDGNVFSIISTVRRALCDAGQRERGDEWVKAAMDCDAYYKVIALASDYVRVS